MPVMMIAATAPSVTSVTPQPGRPSTRLRAAWSSLAWRAWVFVPSPFKGLRAETAKRGRNASVGITAMSCVNRTEKAFRPPVVCINPFSVSVCSTIAVDDRARIRPIAIEDLVSMPMNRQAPVITAAVTTICSPPSPRSLWRMSQRARGSSSSPTRKSIITTPNSAKWRRSFTSDPTSPRTGPMAIPAAK